MMWCRRSALFILSSGCFAQQRFVMEDQNLLWKCRDISTFFSPWLMSPTAGSNVEKRQHKQRLKRSSEGVWSVHTRCCRQRGATADSAVRGFDLRVVVSAGAYKFYLFVFSLLGLSWSPTLQNCRGSPNRNNKKVKKKCFCASIYQSMQTLKLKDATEYTEDKVGLQLSAESSQSFSSSSVSTSEALSQLSWTTVFSPSLAPCVSQARCCLGTLLSIT